MRASRLLSILILLQLRVRLTADDLAREFEVSVRTIYRDIDALSAAGVPVYGDRGPGGGFALLDGYRTRLTGLANDEAEAVLMIGTPGPAAALGLGSAASRARGKVMAALGEGSGKAADRIAGLFHLDPVDWYRAADTVLHLPAIARAVIDQRRLALRYESWKGERDRLVDPVGLVQKGGSWYLVGRVDDDLRTYKVAAIKALDVLDETFDRPKDFDLASHWADQLERFEQGLRQRSAKVRANAAGRKLIAELGAYGARAVEYAGPVGEDGWAELTFPYENDVQASRTLLGLGPDVVVLEPEALRAVMRDMVERISRRLTGPTDTVVA